MRFDHTLSSRGIDVMRRTFVAAALACLIPIASYAQVGETQTNTTVTTSSGNCLTRNPFRKTLTFDASGATANIGYCMGESCTASIGTVGTSTLYSGTIAYWPLGSAPTNAFCFISASGSQPLTIKEGK